MLLRPAQRTYRHWIIDSTRWDHFPTRPGDIVIATYPKCGTTWMQRIVNLLVHQSPAPVALSQMSPWIEMRIIEPIEAAVARLDSQTHRRFVKTHLPLDGLPFHDDVSYIHVARDGHDACMSYHNHCTGLTDDALALLDQAGAADDEVNRDYPRPADDPATFFHDWISQGAVPGHDDGLPHLSYFALEDSYWAQRAQTNVLLVHYNDLQADLHSEMRRIADFLDISLPPSRLPELADAASFESMRRDGDQLLSAHAGMFKGGNDRFFFRAQNQRWRGVIDAQDLALYDAKVAERFSPACAAWVAHGRLVAGEPRSAPD